MKRRNFFLSVIECGLFCVVNDDDHGIEDIHDTRLEMTLKREWKEILNFFFYEY